MSSSATFNRAAQVLRRVAPDLPADDALRDEIATHRHWSPQERRDLARVVFSVYRWINWLDPMSSLQTQASAALALQERFEKHPSSIKPQALAARAVPGWLAEEMELSPDFLRQLQRTPALWLRTRSGKRHVVADAIGDCFAPELVMPSADILPPATGFTTLRYNGTRDLHLMPEFRSGLFEIQDLASQLVSWACAPAAGETWWDACAGEGGKTLHLSDLMQGQGLIWASDRSERRLATLRTRAARAEVFNLRVAYWDGSAQLPTKTPCDGVLVDAPCSGVGTWQRNPHARWSTTPDDVRELAVVQARLLDNASVAVKPGGRLVYSVCTLTRSETSAVADAFGAGHPGFALQHATTVWPQDSDCNGMYLAVWKRL
jgi:16S rRNA (cytosine967-C5)-methyltransferase